MEHEKTISGPGFRATLRPSGKYAFSLETAGRERLRLGRITCAGFGELSALTRHLRTHSSIDSLTASFDSAATIPFGCEFEVRREIELSDGFAQLTLDVAAATRGAVGDLALEEVSFPGARTRLAFLIYGEKSFREFTAFDREEFYRGAEPPVMVRVTSDDGVETEFALGADLWRHRAGFRTPGATGEFAILLRDGEIVLTRQILTYGAEAVVEKRPWRFHNLIAWRVPGKASEVRGEIIAPARAEAVESGFKTAEGGQRQETLCLTSPAARKVIRTLVRRATGNLVLTGVDPGFCHSAAHLERPGKVELEHFDLEDHIVFHLWGNRQLHKNEHQLVMTPSPGGLFADSTAVKNLARAPRLLDRPAE